MASRGPGGSLLSVGSGSYSLALTSVSGSEIGETL